MHRCLVLVGWLLLAVPALGEPPITPKADAEQAATMSFEEVFTDEWKANATPAVVLTGRQVPYRMLVSHWFSAMVGYRTDAEIWASVVGKVGLKPGSLAAQELARVVDMSPGYRPSEAQRSLDSVRLDDLAAAGDDAAYDAACLELEKARAGRLGDLYRELAESLAAAGASIDGIETYIYNNTASGTTMGASGPLTADFYSIGAEFNRRSGLEGPSND